MIVNQIMLVRTGCREMTEAIYWRPTGPLTTLWARKKHTPLEDIKRATEEMIANTGIENYRSHAITGGWEDRKPMRPRHPKPDRNQAEIVRDFRDLGFEVLNISAICSYADIVVWGIDIKRGAATLVWKMFEIKTDDGELTDIEREFQAYRPGAVQTIRCIEDGLRAFGRLEE